MSRAGTGAAAGVGQRHEPPRLAGAGQCFGSSSGRERQSNACMQWLSLHVAVVASTQC